LKEEYSNKKEGEKDRSLIEVETTFEEKMEKMFYAQTLRIVVPGRLSSS
jgi:hypothetical protein